MGSLTYLYSYQDTKIEMLLSVYSEISFCMLVKIYPYLFLLKGCEEKLEKKLRCFVVIVTKLQKNYVSFRQKTS